MSHERSATNESRRTARGKGGSAFHPERPNRLAVILRWTLAVGLVIGVHGTAAWALLSQRPEPAPHGMEASPILIDMAPPASAPELASLAEAEQAPEIVDASDKTLPTSDPEPSPEPEAELPPPDPPAEPLPKLEPEPKPEFVEPKPEAQPEPESSLAEPDVEAPLPPVEKREEVPALEETPEPVEDAVSVPIPTLRPPTPPAVLEAVREREEREDRTERRERRERAKQQERREQAERETRRERLEARRAPAPSTASQGRPQRQASQGRQVPRAAQARWQSAVQARLNRAKRTPAGGGSGTVSIAFSMNGNGGVTSTRIARSGGATLDNAAMALIRRASPFPAPPGGRGVSLTVPIRFE